MRVLTCCFQPLQARKASRRAAFKSAAAYVKEYKLMEKEDLRLKRQARTNAGYYVAEQPNLIFAMR